MAEQRRDGKLAFAAALFLLSGASSLVFEVVWVRQLGQWVGHSAVAMSIVVAAFLGGMAPGAAFVGHRVDRHADPLRLYAWLEAIAGASSLAITMVFSRVHTFGALQWMPQSLALRLILAFLAMLLPASAMGATLPALSRFVATDPGSVGRPFARLYTLNTLGAAAGCALSGFVAIGTIGLVKTAVCASLVDLAVSVVAGLGSLRMRRMHASTSTAAASVLPVGSGARRLIVAVAAASGFASIACEVLWFRALSTFLKASTYAFSLLLATWLLGLAIGGLLFPRTFGRSTTPWTALADAQILLAAGGILSVVMLGRASEFAGLIAHVLGNTAQSDADLPQFVLCAAVVFVPSVLLGATWPLFTVIAAHECGAVGASVGKVSAASTIGGAVGSLVAGLGLLPWLGVQRGLAVALGVHLVVALVARSRTTVDDAVRSRVLRWTAVLVVAWVLLPRDLLLNAVAHYPRAHVLAVREGRDGTLIALAYDRASVCSASPHHCATHCEHDFAFRQLVFGAVSYASTILPARRYMRALAHLPMLLHPRPMRALEICFGTGTTAAAFISHPDLRSLTVVDINPDVLSFARYFRDSNHDVLSDPRTHTVIDDGRRYLTEGRSAYDIISLEPPPPTAEGASTLYTREFYSDARGRLSPDGIVAQWIPLDQQSEILDRALLRSVTDVFRYVELWIPARMEAVVLASDQPFHIDLAQWAARWNADNVRSSLSDVGFPTPASLAATRVMDDGALRRWVADAEAVTDDLPSVSYYRDHRGPRLTAAALLARAIDPGSPFADDPAVMRTVRRLSAAEGLQRAAHDRMLAGDSDGAHRMAVDAQFLAGATPYTDYLTTLEFGCLDQDAP